MRRTITPFVRARLLVSTGLLALAGLPFSAAYAQSEADLLDAARLCQRIAGLSERLACYDRVFPPADRITSGESSRRSGPGDAAASATAPAPAPAATRSAAAAESPTPGGAPTDRSPQATDGAPTPRESPQESLAPEEPQSRSGRRARRAAKSEESESALVRIVAIETPSVGTTLFHASDGRIFVRERARTVPRWPEPPFDVELQTSTFGTSTYLNFPGMNLRVRVAVRE